MFELIITITIFLFTFASLIVNIKKLKNQRNETDKLLAENRILELRLKIEKDHNKTKRQESIINNTDELILCVMGVPFELDRVEGDNIFVSINGNSASVRNLEAVRVPEIFSNIIFAKINDNEVRLILVRDKR